MDHPASSPADLPTPLGVDKSAAPLYAAGAVSTAVALGIHQALLGQGFNVVGFHVNFILPVGAVGLGLVATIGFGVGAWKGGHKITAGTLLLMAAILLAGYFGGQYVEYRRMFPDATRGDGTPFTFVDYFDLAARTMRFSGKRGKPGAALDGWGYAVRALQVSGFVLGGLAAPLVLRGKAYCEACGRYRRNRELAMLAAGIPDKVFGNNSAERIAEREQKLAAATATWSAVLADAIKGDGAAAAEKLRREGPLSERSKADAANARILVSLSHCDRCGEGELSAVMVTGQGKAMKQEPMAAQPVGAGVVEALLAPR